MTLPDRRLRILCIGETWWGSDARSAFAALGRSGHSIDIVDEAHFVPTEWESFAGRALRKAFRSTMVKELTRRCGKLVHLLKPDALFVFKGNYVTPELIINARSAGALALNYYPDVSFFTHGPQLPKALLEYDHVFNAKSFGLADMQSHGVRSVSFLPPGFDPEVHRPLELSKAEEERFACDVSFIGTWSPKKESILSALAQALPQIRLRVWGNQWEKRQTRSLDKAVMGMGITGDDYTRAICASKISLGLLSEARTGASSGDLITARTFQIPACGSFMLHERTSEVAQYFQEGRDAEFFEGGDELAEKVRRFLADDSQRSAIARNGRARSIESDYSIDERMSHVTAWIDEHIGARRAR
jgi:glycosyltransferase involved in cell wall biosynthesis